MSDGQLAVNTNATSTGLFFKDSAGALVKVGPVHVGTTAPNATPATGGEAGNSVGEQWLDTSGGGYSLKIWDGSAWRSEAGEFVNASGDTMTGALVMDNQQQVRFRETTANGTNFIALQAPASVASDKTITLPDVTGTVVTTGDTGTVTSTMIADSTIVDGDISASAEIAVSKLADGSARQLLQTDAAGTGVEWTSNVDVPGTLDVTSTATFDSIISASAGAAATPSITFTGDTNTGIYSPGADQLAISTNGTGRLFVDASGNVGIGAAPVVSLAGQTHLTVNHSAGGTSVAGYNLAVNGTKYASLISYPSNSEALRITAESATLPITFHTNSSERMRLDSSGRLGLGTSSPAYQLDLGGGTTVSSRIQLQRGSDDTNQHMRLGWSGIDMVRANVALASAQTSFSLNQVGSDGTRTCLYVNSSGNVGIGTTGPSAKLQVDHSGTTTTLATFSNPGVATVYLGISGQSENYYDANTQIFRAGNSSSEYGRWDSSGRFLVGTSSAQGTALLQVNGDSSAATNYSQFTLRRGLAASSYGGAGNFIGQINFEDLNGGQYGTIRVETDAACGTNDYPGRLVFSVTRDGQASPTEALRIANSGRSVFLGNTNALDCYSAQGAGTSFETIIGGHSATTTAPGSGTVSFKVFTNGNVQNTNNSYGSLSDAKLKKNIVDANSQWDDLKSLRVRNYNFKEGQTHRQIGLIAQEAELVSPGLVSETPDRDAEGNDLGTVTKSVNYSVLYMKAVKALQEAMERIETLEAEVSALKAS
jgi:hypothetical protein